MYRDVLAIVLAGGRGSRLEPLTRDRAKPAVPFGGIYRIIDFTLSNCINSDIRKILVLTQYKATSLNRHIDEGWKFLSRELDEYIEVIPPQQRIAEMWYQGTADAIYQNVYTIEKSAPRDTLILAGDHIYKMNYARMIEEHRANNADLTIACQPVPLTQATDFGVMGVDGGDRVTSFLEKPKDPPGIPGQPEVALASMGIYVFNTDVMYELLFQDAARKEASSHDFGRDIIPAMIAGGSRVLAYPFRDENRKGAAYWRNVGTIDAYFQTSLDLIQVDPILNLYDRDWPIHTHQPAYPPPKFVHTEGDRRARRTTRSSARAPLSRAARCSAASSRRACGCTATRWWRTRSCSTACRWAATPAFAARSSTRTCASPAASRSAGTARPTSPGASPCRRKASPSSPRARISSGLGRRWALLGFQRFSW